MGAADVTGVHSAFATTSKPKIRIFVCTIVSPLRQLSGTGPGYVFVDNHPPCFLPVHSHLLAFTLDFNFLNYMKQSLLHPHRLPMLVLLECYAG
jgi:hypothetical protein